MLCNVNLCKLCSLSALIAANIRTSGELFSLYLPALLLSSGFTSYTQCRVFLYHECKLYLIKY